MLLTFAQKGDERGCDFSNAYPLLGGYFYLLFFGAAFSPLRACPLIAQKVPS